MYGPTKLRRSLKLPLQILELLLPLILSGLCAEGYTRDAFRIFRSWVLWIPPKTTSTGADVERVNEEENQLTEAELEKMFN